MRIPSGSSHAESTRKNGGAFVGISSLLRGSVCDWSVKHYGEETFLSSRCKQTNNLNLIPEVFTSSPLSYRSACPKVVSNKDPQYEPSSYEMIEFYEEPRNLKKFFGYLLEDYFGARESWGNNVYPVALPEPLKVRLISRGPMIRYWLGSAIQKWMHSTLRKHATFVAIGQPLESSILDERLGRCGDGEVYLSGDYKAATDLLDPYLSLTCCQALSEQGELNEVMTEILKEGLVGADLQFSAGPRLVPHYRDDVFYRPSWSYEKVCAGIKQNWGQLMGSPLSFPILCIVNAAINRYFFELVQRDQLQKKRLPAPDRIVKRRLVDVPMLINGDDLLMRLPDGYYDAWKSFVLVAGLTPSVGKNYVSKSFVIINSTLFQQNDSMLGQSNFQEEPYINSGLLHPVVNSRNSLSNDHFSLDPQVWDLGQVSHRLVKGFSPEVQDRMMSIYIGDPTVRGLLGGINGGISYYASKTLGGVGLKATRGGLLSPEQQGYYTRIATTRGEYAPLVPDVSAQETIASLQSRCKGESISEDWNLELRYPGPSSSQLWDSYLAEDPSELVVQNITKTLMKENGSVNVNGVLCRGYMAGIISPVSTGIFRSHTRPWPDHNICNFPWSRQTLSVYEESCVQGDLSLFAAMGNNYTGFRFDHKGSENHILDVCVDTSARKHLCWA
jgi:hypothetical protein